MATKRPQNKCGNCGNTWYPRGKDVSSRCPECRSADVDVVPSHGLESVGLVIGAGLLFMCCCAWPYNLLFGPPKNAEVAQSPHAPREREQPSRPVKVVTRQPPTDPRTKATTPPTRMTESPDPLPTPTIDDAKRFADVGGWGRGHDGSDLSARVSDEPSGSYIPKVKQEPPPVLTLNGSEFAPIAMATDGTNLAYYVAAVANKNNTVIHQMKDGKTLYLVTEPVSVVVESRTPKAVYVRVQDGKHTGKLMAVSPSVVPDAK